jgi:hypothetical protein
MIFVIVFTCCLCLNASAEKVSPNKILNAQHSIIKLLPNLTLSRDHVVTISSNDGAYVQNGWFAQSGSWEHIPMHLVGSPTNVVITLRGPANTDYLLYVLYLELVKPGIEHQ